MAATTTARFRAAIVAIAPALLLIGFIYHPYVANGTDEASIADAASSDTTRWGLSHLAIGVGYALMTVAFIACRSYLRDAGEERWSAWALPFAVFGSALFPILTGMEFASLAAAETNGDVEAAQSELAPWFIPILAMAAICFTFGALGFAIGIASSAVLSRQLTRLVVAALILMSAARFVPLGAAQILIGAAGIMAFWPLAWEMWRHLDARPAQRIDLPSVSGGL